MRFENSQEIYNMEKAINEPLMKGAVEPCQPCKNQFLSKYFLRQKADGSYRFILNLVKLNDFIKTEHFKMENIKSVENLLFPGDFMGTIDLKDAFFLILIHNDSKKYLRFEFRGQLFQFTCLPFGLNISPLIFTKLIRVVVNLLRKRGSKSIAYLDNLLCIAQNYKDCDNNLKETIHLFEKLGFIINYSKSSLIPNTKCKYLGLVIDSVKYTIELTADKKQNIMSLLNNLKRKRCCSLFEFSKILGKLIFACQGTEYGLLYTRIMEHEKTEALIQNKGNFKGKINISEQIMLDTNWWLLKLKNSSKSIKTFEFKAEIFTDASNSGWGATNGSDEAYGYWDSRQKQWHINYKELIAIKLALTSIASNLRHCEILLRVDNTTAIAYINRMGGTRHMSYNSLARQIWKWAEERNIFLVASYIPSLENSEADRLSRLNNIDIEWELNNNYFNQIIKQFGNPEYDLFATYKNAKCPKFISWIPDNRAETVDAFTISWAKLKFYAFPPFSLILKTLTKIRRDQATGIILVPYWPSQPCYPLLTDLIISKIIKFGPDPHMLLSPCRNVVHPQAQCLTLISAIVCGKPS